ncbi:MAG: RHS repeat protein, partial [Candidatus Melainabacteria bacterium]|nr:RHS repeat protein [Candidatus Melainabacteria bacterium]
NGLTVTASASSTLTWDANGNLISDGTNTYKWDAENRLVEIDYPGVNNYSQFSYDGLWRNTKIVETTSGSVTGTKQFVWSGDSRKEERDGSGTTVSKLFTRGQTTTGSLFCYTLDHLSSVRELVDVAGTSQSQISYSPFGQEKFTISNVVPALAYASYYAHQRSHFGLTTFREYGSQQGRWLSRDPNADSTFATIQETLDPADPSAASFGKLKQLNPNLLAIQNATHDLSQLVELVTLMSDINMNAANGKPKSNLYTYVGNSPLQYNDPSGLDEHWAWCTAYCTLYAKGALAYILCMQDCMQGFPKKCLVPNR